MSARVAPLSLLLLLGAVASPVVAQGVAPAVRPAMIPVAVLAHPVAQGNILSAEDFAYEDRALGQARGALQPADAIGKEATRGLAPGSVVRITDVVTPRLVRRGEPVLIAYRSRGLLITTNGRALASAGSGEPVRVVAASTARTLDGVAAASGLVLVGP
jgi:flagella basal body P-ring formation protein FlgA